ncbi:MAG: GvpL/GvpF family gas vesicle protein, partial [Candidatus Omnitrophica bacterium]|nr:GvpL/GvpF family gas vesicle protein [Candidatus Omnitrophota bacterium]
IEEPQPKTFGPLGIGGSGDELVSVSYKELACVVSHSLIVEYPVTREHTMAHHQAIERVMQEYAVLPVRFSTIAKSDEEIIEKVLTPRYEEFKRLLAWISGKGAIEVRASWITMDTIFQDLVQESPALQALKAKIAGKPTAATYYDRIELGKLVEARLKDTRRDTADQILSVLKPHACEFRDNSEKLYGDQPICNLSFLVEEERIIAFDQAVAGLRAASNGRFKVKVNHRVAPFDFVTIVIQLDEASHVSA